MLNRCIAAMNLELAIADYFTEPTVDEARAMRVLIASLQEDQERIKMKIQRESFSGCVVHHDSGL